ncbi:virulence factor MviN [Maribacter sp. MJ134]|uniref:murein biosynthesis integral membrane protein MurJ n=1 Tax=Maribacter sp. MJ134 TaxID=2496865 RepID=UPI000F838F49|nr:lipid II flippase MurJ [Maribacter sp. MJ134]AZQ58472.1 virulence factor MviN [Maribacter sp. MJ134]
MQKKNKAKIQEAIKSSINNSLIRNMLIVGSITFFIKLLTFYKETLVASIFGLSELLDTYYIAILIPTFIQNVFIGSLKGLFIPNYITELKTTKKGPDFLSLILLSIILIVVLFTILAIIFTEFFLCDVFPNHNSDYYSLIRTQFYYALPCLLFWGISGLFTGLLEIKGKYLISTASQILLPAAIIICLLCFKNYLGEITLVIGMLLGSFLSTLFLFLFCAKDNLIKLGDINLNFNMILMLRQYPAKVTSGLLTGINPFVDQFFAAQLIIGSIAAMNYGMKIPSFTVGIIMMVIGNVLLPHFSNEISDNIQKAFKQLYKILKLVFTSSLIIAIITIIFSDYIIALLFERDNFSSEDTEIVSLIQKIALLYVPFYLCTLICVNFLTALNKNKFMAWVSFWNLITNLILNMVLIKKFGVYGLVWSTTIVYIISSFIYLGYTYKQYNLNRAL